MAALTLSPLMSNVHLPLRVTPKIARITLHKQYISLPLHCRHYL